MWIERLINWVCVVIMAAIAGVYTFAVGAQLFDGQISAFSKAKIKQVHSLSVHPIDFWATAAVHLMLAGAFWWFAYWIWQNRLRADRR